MLFEKAQLSHKDSALSTKQFYHVREHYKKVLASHQGLSSDWAMTIKGLAKDPWSEPPLPMADEEKLHPELSHAILQLFRQTYRQFQQLKTGIHQAFEHSSKSALVCEQERSNDLARKVFRSLSLEHDLHISKTASLTPEDLVGVSASRIALPIKATWKRSVFDKGLHIAVGSNVNILVVTAKEQPSIFLNKEGYKIYEVIGVTLNRYKDKVGVKGFVFINNGGGIEPVYSPDFSLGVKLIKRRAAKAVFKELDI